MMAAAPPTLPPVLLANGEMAATNLLCFGLNPAHQHTLIFESGWERNQVNRASGSRRGVGGKGQTFAKAASQIEDCAVAVAQFLGPEGDAGRFVQQSLGELPSVLPVTQWTAQGRTRTCTTLLVPGAERETELIEPSSMVQPADIAALKAKVEGFVRGNVVHGLAICGTSPPGVPPSFLADMICVVIASIHNMGDGRRGETGRLERHRPFVLLDGHKDVGHLLDGGWVDGLKLNATELHKLAGTQQNDAGADGTSIAAAARALFARCEFTHRGNGLRVVAVTNGPAPAFLFVRGAFLGGADRAWRLEVPRVAVVNPIGAGDTVSAVLLHALALAGGGYENANAGVAEFAAAARDGFRRALAAGSVSCKSGTAADIPSWDEVEALAQEVQVFEIPFA